MVYLLIPIALVSTFAGVYALWRHAMSIGLVDVPNARSSHTKPIARGGGLAFVVVICASLVFLSWRELLPPYLASTVLIGGGAVAAVGYVDDHRGLSARARIVCHLAAAAFAIWAIGGWNVYGQEQHGPVQVALQFTAVIGIVWMLNLFNFMDGIDGFAASQMLFASLGWATLLALEQANVGWVVYLLVIAASAFGFLVWNWPPARIFMGDVGSGFAGFVLGSTAIVLDNLSAVSVWASLTLLSIFVADATVTLIRRAVRGERWYSAHRQHAYQRLARRWGGHGKVTRSLWGANLLLTWPLAVLATLYPQVAWPIAVCTVAAFGCLALAAGAGGSDEHNSRSS